MQLFKAISNTTIYDVCLNTYGTVNFLVKLLVDNNYGSVNKYPLNEQEFIFDETLVLNPKEITKVSEKYATRNQTVGNNINLEDMYYEQNIGIDYTAASDGETVIIIPELANALRIVQLEKEIKPVLVANFSFNSPAGRINLLNGVTMSTGQTLFIIYAKLITA